jgi:amino acid adenylation domain-containing protein
MVGSCKNEQNPVTVTTALNSTPLSYAQQRIWLMHQLEHNSTEYNMLWAQRLRGKLNLSALSKALNTIVQRHEPLRSCISDSGDGAVQSVLPVAELEIAIDDLRQLDPSAQEAYIARAVRDEGDNPIDLTGGLAIRTRLLRVAEEEYVWIRVFHHIHYDGWSDGLFCRELTALYNAFCDGMENPLEPLHFRYRDFAISQRQAPAGKSRDGVAYWKNKLAGIPHALELPTDRPHSTNPVRGAGLHHVTLLAEQIQGIRRVAQADGATFYMAMLAAFAVLLSRYSRQSDIVVGSPASGRRGSSAVEDVIGCFVNTLALRIQVNSRSSFRELLSTVRETALDAYDHQDVPFERIVEELSPARNANRHPLFQVFLSMQDTPSYPLRLRDLQADPPYRLERLRSRFDLELQVSLRPGEPTLCWAYKRGLFDDWRIEQMAKHYVTLINAVITDPGREIYRLDSLSTEDRAVAVGGFKRTERALPRTTVSEMFEQQAKREPDAAAILFRDEVITYGQLNEQANRLAHCLIARGLRSEDVVGIVMDRTPDLVVAMIATWKARAVFLPLDPDYPPARLNMTLSDAKPACVLCTTATAAKLPLHFDRLIVDTPESRAILQSAPTHHPADLDCYLGSDASPAYLIYTSGSTGKPKGVAGLHLGLVNRLLWFNDAFPAGAGGRILARTSIGFIDGLTELCGSLVQGALIVLADSTTGKNPSALIDLVDKQQISRMTMVPSLLKAAVDEPKARQLKPCSLFVSSGEALLSSHAKRLWEVVPESRLLNLYGCSECSGDSVFSECLTTDIVAGTPIWNTSIYILDDDLQPTPIGVAGELYISGLGLARGYWHQPGLTAQRFVVDPYGRPGGRMYRSGDVGRWRRDGNVEVLGRVDRQVQIHGQRVELGEIETALRDQPSVREAAVIEWDGESGEALLIAYVVPSAKHSFDAYELRRQLLATMPSYMIPTSFQSLESLPRLVNGKVDIKALPPPVMLPKRSSRLPRTPIEERLCALFEEVLKVGSVGIDDDFFEIGGHSMLATMLANRIRDTLGFEFTLRTILEAGTVANLSERCQ